MIKLASFPLARYLVSDRALLTQLTGHIVLVQLRIYNVTKRPLPFLPVSVFEVQRSRNVLLPR